MSDQAPVSELRGPVDGPLVQKFWPGRWCDTCRSSSVGENQLATHARDNAGGGRDFFCDLHFEEEQPDG